MARILIVGKGGYGDMFPMFAIAQALQANGHAVDIAAEGHHGDAAKQINIPIIRLDPEDKDRQFEGNGFLTQLRRAAEVLQTLSPRHIETEYEILLAIAGNYDLIIGNQLAYCGAMVAKKTGKPWVFCAPSPLAFPSRLAAPLFPYLHSLQKKSMAYSGTQRPYIALARAVSNLMMTPVVRQQRKLGLGYSGHPRFEGLYSEHLNLLMTSPALVTQQPDWPSNTVLAGFSWFEPEFMQGQLKLDNLAQFIDSGPPPIVFAPGGSKRTQPGQFFIESIKACRALGVRGIILAAQRFHQDIPSSPDILVTGYLPYSKLLQHASAVVHSAGIGAIGWGLRHAVPSLLVPSSWDQFDNAYRTEQKNLALVMSQREYKADTIAKNLHALLNNQEQLQLIKACSSQIAREDGARVACDQIETILQNVGNRCVTKAASSPILEK